MRVTTLWLRRTTRQRVNETTSGAVAGLLSCRLVVCEAIAEPLVVCEATAKPNASATRSLVVSWTRSLRSDSVAQVCEALAKPKAAATRSLVDLQSRSLRSVSEAQVCEATAKHKLKRVIDTEVGYNLIPFPMREAPTLRWGVLRIVERNGEIQTQCYNGYVHS